VGGDSAGANLAAAVAAVLAGDEARPKAALLMYGVFDFTQLGNAPPAPGMDPGTAAASREAFGMMMAAYLGTAPDPAALRDPQVSPLYAAAKLPPCHVVVGGADPLAVQAEALASALAAAGVPHEHFVDAGMPHGYLQMEFLPGARPALERMVAFLGRNV